MAVRKRSQYLFPAIAFALVWIPGSVWRAYEFSRRVRFPGPGQYSWTPFLDSMTQTLQAWLAPAFFVGVFVFVLERWLEERKEQRQQTVPEHTATLNRSG